MEKNPSQILDPKLEKFSIGEKPQFSQDEIPRPNFAEHKGKEEKSLTDDEIRNEINNFARKIFFVFSSQDKEMGYDFSYIHQSLEKMIEASPRLGFEKALKIFVTGLIDQCQNNQNLKSSQKTIERIVNKFFPSQPNLVSPLNLQDSFDLTAKSTRITKLQGSIGARMADDLTEKIINDYHPENNDILLENYQAKNQSEKFDCLHLLELIMAKLSTSPRGYTEGRKKIKSLIGKIKTQTNSAFINYYLEVINERLEKEEKHPTKSIFVRYNDASESRLIDFLSIEEKKESEELKKRFSFDKEIKEGHSLIQLAEDLLAVLDHSNTPIQYTKIKLSEEKLGQNQIDSTELQKVIDLIEKRSEEIGIRNINQLIYQIETLFLAPYYKIDPQNTEKLAEKLSQYSNSLDPQFWKKYFLSEAKIAQEIKKKNESRDQVNHTLREKNFLLTQEFYKKFRDNANDIVARYKDKNKKFVELLQKFDELLKDKTRGNDLAFEVMEDFIKILALENGYFYFDSMEDFNKETKIKNSIDKELITDFVELLNNHEKNIANYRKKVLEHDKRQRINLEEFDNIARQILQDPNFLKVLLGDIKIVNEGISSKLTKLKLKEFSNLPKDIEVLQSENAQEIALLLSHLYRPVMRKKIEGKLGFEFINIPVRFQVYLLDFLSTKTEEEVKEAREFLNRASNPEERNQRVKAFVSLEYGKDFGATLIETEKGKYISKEQFQEIISKYLQLEKTASDFRNSLGKLEFAGPNFINQVYDAILRRSTEILTVAYKIAKEGKAETKFYQKDTISSNSMDEVIEALTTYQKSLEIFSALISKNKQYSIQYLSQETPNSEPISYFHFMGKNPKNNQPFHLMIQTRTHGVKNDSIVKEKEYDGEARINFLLVHDPKNPENVSENTANPEREKALSFRIDREGKQREGDIIVENDPSTEKGEVSWEVSHIGEILGRILSLGNALTLEKRGLAGVENPQYYHCRDAFSKEYGEAENFAGIAESFKNKLMEIYSD